MNPSLANRLQIWGFEQDYIVFSDGSLGFGLSCVPFDTATLSDEKINSYSERVSQFLNSLPAHLDIQFVQDIEAGNIDVIERHEKLSAQSNNEIAKSLCLERVKRLKVSDQAGHLPVHSLKVFVRRPMTEGLLQKPKILSREKQFQSISDARLNRELQMMTRLKENIVQGLTSLDLKVHELSSDQIANLLYQQWNPSRRIPFKSYDPEEVRQSLLFSDVGIDISGFVVGTTHFRVLSLKTLPDQTYSAMASLLRELPFKSRLSLTVHVPNQAKEIESLQTQRRIAYSMVVGKKTGVSDLESAAKFQDLETLLEQMIAQGQKVFHASMTVLLQHEDPLELESQCDAVLTKFRELSLP